MRMFSTALVLVLCSTEAAVAQTRTSSSPSASSAAFEVASIKPVPPDLPLAIDFKFLPGHFVATNLTLGQLIQQAYGIESREVIGGPDWVRTERFNVTATTAGTADRDRMKLMLQSLLAVRFQLQLTHEVRTGPTYALTVNQIHDLKPPADGSMRPWIGLFREDANGLLSYHLDGHNASMATLAQTLSREVRAPVVDRTNLTGSYDFRIRFAYNFPFGGLDPDPDVPSTIFKGLERELGLKLVAAKGSIPVFVIKRATRPTPD